MQYLLNYSDDQSKTTWNKARVYWPTTSFVLTERQQFFSTGQFLKFLADVTTTYQSSPEYNGSPTIRRGTFRRRLLFAAVYYSPTFTIRRRLPLAAVYESPPFTIRRRLQIPWWG